MARSRARADLRIDPVPRMRLNIEYPKVAVVMERVLVQGAVLSAEEEQLPAPRRRSNNCMRGSWAWTRWRYEFAPFVFLWGVPKDVVVKVLWCYQDRKSVV